MDIAKLAEVLRATLQPDQREEAEKQLEQVTNHAVPCRLKLTKQWRCTLFDITLFGISYLTTFVMC